jgi:large subunit ribosomal protein L23
MNNSPDQILLKPIITEKSLLDASRGVFTFMVAKFADKYNIKKVVENQFGVHVQKISTIKMTGKRRLVGRRRTKVAESDWKKAKVMLRNGEKIDLFETEGAPTKG